jgi:hypothetical protein
MRKLLVLMVLVGLLLGVLPAAVSATPVAELTDLARYLPAETPVFAAFRTDDGFVETLDALAARISAAIPGMGVPGRLSAMLDLMAQQLDQEGDFQSVFRPWLGDTMAFGLLSLEPIAGGDNPEFVVVISVTNRDEAESFVDALRRQTLADYKITTENMFTLYEAEDRNMSLAITDDALFLTEQVGTLRSLNTREARLNTFGAFTDTVGALPLGDYDAVLYLDSPTLARAMFEMGARRDRDVAAMMGQMEGFLSAAAPQAIGVSVSGAELVIDSAQLPGDTSALEEMGFVLPTSMAPVGFDFAAHVPADAPLVVLGTNLSETYNLMIQNLRAAMQLQVEAGNEEAEDFEQGLRFVEIGVRGLTGLDLQEDILGWMTGNYALFLNVNPEGIGSMAIMPLDFGLVFEATDPAAAQAVVDGIREAITQSEPENVTLTQETVAGVDAAVITAEPEDEPYPVEILVGSNDEVFVIGTRNAFTAAIEPVSGGLAADAGFTAAQSHFLEDSAVVFYFTPQPLESLVDMLAASGDDEMEEGAGFIQLLTALVDSSSITATYNEDGTRGRFVLSLAE